MTSPKGVRQVKGDIVKYMDSLREHACDWTIGMRKEMSDIRSKIALWIQAIRAAIDAAIAYLFGTPFMQTLKKAIAWIKAKIRLIKKIARIIQEKIAYYLDYLRAVLELIEFILTLPAQLLEMFQKCLTQLLGDFGATLKMATQLVTDPLGYTLKTIGNEFSKIDALPETPEETKFLQDLEAAGMPENPETP
jgi:phosphoserine phosphatase